MAFDVVYWVAVGIALVVLILVVPAYGFFQFRRWLWREHVWIDMTFTKGKTDRWLVKPDEDGTIHTKWGTYFTSPTAITLFNGGWRMGGIKPLFHFQQDDPRPIRYTTKYVVSANPGKLERVSVAAHQVIPAPTLAVYMKQKMFADAYSGRGALILVIVIGLVVLFLMVAGLYVRR